MCAKHVTNIVFKINHCKMMIFCLACFKLYIKEVTYMPQHQNKQTRLGDKRKTVVTSTIIYINN